MFEPSFNQLTTVTVSLTNGAPSATILTGVSGRNFVTKGLLASTNDSAAPLLTVQDSSGTPLLIYKGYVSNTSPTTAYLGWGSKAANGKNIVASCPSITAAKTVEVVLVGFWLAA